VEWLILIVPQLVMAGIVCPIWNPIERAASVVQGSSAVVQKAVAVQSHAFIYSLAKLFWWNLRDLVACDFIIVPLLIVCPVLYFKRKNNWFLRAPMAFLMYIGGIALFTAHPTPAQGNAEVRYLAPLLPLCIGISILAVWGAQFVPGWVRAGLLGLSVVAVFLPLNHSSALNYYRELWQPAVEPYTPVAEWVRQNVPAGSTIYVCPDLCVSPMMWNAPQATYVWQLSDPPKPDYANLPAIYFKGKIAPDYVIAFGPYTAEAEACLGELKRQGTSYQSVATIPVYYKEMFRPELIWRSFETIKPTAGEQVYIFRRTTSSAGTGAGCTNQGKSITMTR
jgi:hypothetical protein